MVGGQRGWQEETLVRCSGRAPETRVARRWVMARKALPAYQQGTHPLESSLCPIHLCIPASTLCIAIATDGRDALESGKPAFLRAYFSRASLFGTSHQRSMVSSQFISIQHVRNGRASTNPPPCGEPISPSVRHARHSLHEEAKIRPGWSKTHVELEPATAFEIDKGQNR
jgi:hypothetical protein